MFRFWEVTLLSQEPLPGSPAGRVLPWISFLRWLNWAVQRMKVSWFWRSWSRGAMLLRPGWERGSSMQLMEEILEEVTQRRAREKATFCSRHRLICRSSRHRLLTCWMFFLKRLFSTAYTMSCGRKRSSLMTWRCALSTWREKGWPRREEEEEATRGGHSCRLLSRYFSISQVLQSLVHTSTSSPSIRMCRSDGSRDRTQCSRRITRSCSIRECPEKSVRISTCSTMQTSLESELVSGEGDCSLGGSVNLLLSCLLSLSILSCCSSSSSSSSDWKDSDSMSQEESVMFNLLLFTSFSFCCWLPTSFRKTLEKCYWSSWEKRPTCLMVTVSCLWLEECSGMMMVRALRQTSMRGGGEAGFCLEAEVLRCLAMSSRKSTSR